MIRHDTQLKNFYTMLQGNAPQDLLAKIFMFLLDEHMVPVLGTPLQMVHILSDTMARANQTQQKSRPGWEFYGTRLWRVRPSMTKKVLWQLEVF